MPKLISVGKDTFPSVLARSEVVEVKYEHLSPIHAAITNVKEASRSLKAHTSPQIRKLKCVSFPLKFCSELIC
jgi:hypothetical protein